MDQRDIEQLLNKVRSGRLSVAPSDPGTPTSAVRGPAIRESRSSSRVAAGVCCEVVYARGKNHSTESRQIVRELMRPKAKHNILVTRANREIYRAVRRRTQRHSLNFHSRSESISIQRNEAVTGKGSLLVISAGTSDIPVAEEAAVTAEIMGNKVTTIYDVGVAGIHRLLRHRDQLEAATVIVCVAGMEGALPSVIGGLVGVPVIGVPTSTGYGASFGGMTALLTMLNSCASNVCVVNIDNGFGAGYLASLINRD